MRNFHDIRPKWLCGMHAIEGGYYEGFYPGFQRLLKVYYNEWKSLSTWMVSGCVQKGLSRVTVERGWYGGEAGGRRTTAGQRGKKRQGTHTECWISNYTWYRFCYWMQIKKPEEIPSRCLHWSRALLLLQMAFTFFHSPVVELCAWTSKTANVCALWRIQAKHSREWQNRFALLYLEIMHRTYMNIPK